MKTPRQDFESRVATAATALWSNLPSGPFIRPCLDARHGDFQANLALVLAKEQKANPRDLAKQLVEKLQVSDIALQPEIAGAGFINFRMSPEYISKQVEARAHDARLGINRVENPTTVVVDFSSPNIAKELHVGHLRSTVLGDALQRILRFLGYNVITDNHLGDWGTGFGIVLYGYKKEGDAAKLADDPFTHLEDIYKRYTALGKEDPAIREACKAELVKLQQGDPENLQLWKQFVQISIEALKQMYARMGVTFDNWYGESFYNDMLPSVIEELTAQGIARESRGAMAIFSDETLKPDDDPFKVRDKETGEFKDQPLLIQKSDEGFNYATTDLATFKYRVNTWKADRILYVVDERQRLHFRQLFNAAKRWGGSPVMEHVGFGTMQGPDKKPMKTKSGENIKLKVLLDEAVERAGSILNEKRPDLSEVERQELARIVGIGALKYADLAQNRDNNYVFDWDKLLAFDGNTAPYIQNAYVRTRGILRKSGLTEAPNAPVLLAHATEMSLAKKLLDFEDSITMAAEETRPHFICQYLFDLANLFHKFFEDCPVLKEGVDEATKNSRLVLCCLTGETLKVGLNLLGIETLEKM